MLLLSFACESNESIFSVELIPTLDQEEKISEDKVLSSSTQSINRYHSILRNLSKLNFDYFPQSKKIALTLGNSKGQVFLHHIDSRFLVPYLPYVHSASIDDFDKANLLLAEFARSGVSLSFQEHNTRFGFFNSEDGLFNEKGEYEFVAGEIRPNPQVLPKRISLVNNCLHPGLWELNATDAVGEIYHSWFSLPQEDYFRMIKENNGIENSQEELSSFLEEQKVFSKIPLELDRLRAHKTVLNTTMAQMPISKMLGAYSSQDSRRKVQRGFYEILRGEEQASIQNFSELKKGDVFSLHSFVPPGVYHSQQRMKISYQDQWGPVTFSIVEPKTFYDGQHDRYGQYGYLEMELFNLDSTQSIIVGNIPIQLLVLSEDYKIPAFGVGVWNASEPIERRFLRFQEGSFPHYAYLVENREEKRYLVNNHELGYEQIFLRPFHRDGHLFLRMTVVSYERIVDLMEFEIPLVGDLAERIRKASLEYQPPIYEVYKDSNVL